MMLFMVSVFVGMVAWTYVRNKVWPPPPPKVEAWAYKGWSVGEQADVVVRLATAVSGHGIGDAVNLAAQYARTPARPKVPKPPEPSPEVVAARKAEEAKPAQEITMGGAGFPITAKLTSRGAGVSELILNHFRAADYFGLPVKDAAGNPVPLTLIPKQTDPPAFAIFHYLHPDEKEERPVDTLGKIVWTVARQSLEPQKVQEVVFTADLPEAGVKLTKTFRLAPNEYHLGLNVGIERLSANGEKFRYQLAGAHGLPIEGEWYTTTFRNALIGLIDSNGTVYRPMVDAARIYQSGGSDRFRKDDKRFIYAAVALQYFTSAIVVDNLGEDGAELKPERRNFVQFVRATEEGLQDPRKPFLADITVRAISEAMDVAAPVSHNYMLYHGPVKVRQLSRLRNDEAVAPGLVDRYADTLHLRTLTDYGSMGWWSDLIILFTNLIHKLLGFLTTFLPYGIAIICVTIVVRGLMLPISVRQAKGMQRMQEKMQKVAPEMKEIEKKFKDDFLGKQQAQRELYRKHNINPAAGLGGCFMLILQMPIFMGLYFALQESVFFRLESFLWIRNLAAPDMLFWWGENIPWISTRDAQGSLFYLGPYFNLLPIVAAALIFVQQKLSMPKEMTAEQRQQFAIMKYMTAFMVIMFYKVPAGLSIYFIASSVWGLLERRFVKKRLAQEAAEPPKPAAGPGSGKSKAKPVTKEPGRFQLWWEKVLREASKK
jgi:YidC/Oxa1 family membrane protein insertase